MRINGKDIQVKGRLIRIAALDGDKYKFLDNPEPVIDSLKRSNARVDIFTFMQRLPDTSPKYAYPMEWDNLAALPISSFEEWWTERLGFKARNKAKQAGKKGVEIREVAFDDALVEGISEIYNESPIRQGRRFSHYRRSIDSVRQVSSTFPDESIFIGAFLDQKLIGFIKLTIDDSRTQAGIMHIVSMIKHRDKAPTNALVAQAVRSCADRGIPYLVYSNFAYGKKERSGLSDFKERNGFQRIELPRYYVPLTWTGWAAFHAGLHHKLVDHFPESLAAKARDFRYAWYKRRFPALAQDFQKDC
jgi:hypothetical protein